MTVVSLRDFLRPFELLTFLLEALPWKVEGFNLVGNCYTPQTHTVPDIYELFRKQ